MVASWNGTALPCTGDFSFRSAPSSEALLHVCVERELLLGYLLRSDPRLAAAIKEIACISLRPS